MKCEAFIRQCGCAREIRRENKKMHHFSQLDSTISPFTVIIIISYSSTSPTVLSPTCVCVCELRVRGHRNAIPFKSRKVKEHSFLPSVSDYYYFLCDSTPYMCIPFGKWLLPRHPMKWKKGKTRSRRKNEQKIGTKTTTPGRQIGTPYHVSCVAGAHKLL